MLSGLRDAITIRHLNIRTAAESYARISVLSLVRVAPVRVPSVNTAMR